TMPIVFPSGIEVQTHDGPFKLKVANLGLMQFLEAVDKAVTPREFAVLFVHTQLILPEMDLDSVRGLSNRTLGRIIRSWSRDKFGFDRALAPRTPVFEAFRLASSEYLKEESEQLSKSLGDLSRVIPRTILSSTTMRALEGAIWSAKLFEVPRISIPTTLPSVV